MRTQLIKILFLSAFFYSCGKDDGKGAGTSISPLRGTTWHGQLLNSGGANLSPTPISLSFFGDETFRATAPNDASKIARGRYRDMPLHRNIMIEISDSNFEEFAKAGAYLNFDYSAQGGELVLRSGANEMRLVQEGQTDPANSDHPLHGSWRCPEIEGGYFLLDIDAQNFWGRRLQKGRAAVRFEGRAQTISRTQDGSANLRLSIERATERSFFGRTLMFSVKRKLKPILQEIDSDDKPVEGGLALDCQLDG